MTKRWRCRVVLLVLALCTGVAVAEPYPNRPLRIIVPGATAGVLDVNARLVADKLAQSLGQPVLVDNRPGANGIIGVEAAARAAPDGYTLLVASVTHLSINPLLYPSLPYDPARDFVPLTLAARGEPLLIVSPRLPAKTLDELVQHARARPGQVSFGSPGIGSLQHLAGELLQQLAGVKLGHVPYKSQPQTLADLMSGELDVAIEFASIVTPAVESGRVRALAVAGTKRKPSLPEVPTAAEAKLPGFEVVGWNGYLVPAGTPKEIVTRLQREIAAAVKSPDLVERTAKQGSETVASSGEEFAATIAAETRRWAELVRRLEIKLE